MCLFFEDMETLLALGGPVVEKLVCIALLFGNIEMPLVFESRLVETLDCIGFVV